MKIAIIGSRRRNEHDDYAAVYKAFMKAYNDGDTIVSGGCPKGGDKFAEIIAKKNSIPILIYKADWSIGRHAGFLRNSNIAEDSNILIACVAADRKGGTEDTIKKFRKFHPKGKLILV